MIRAVPYNRTTMTEPEPPQSDESARQSFIVEKLGDIYAESAKVAAALNLLTPTQAGKLAGRNRTLLYIVIALLLILIAVLVTHAAFEAGWLGG